MDTIQRDKPVQKQNRATNIITPKLSVRDFVLVSTAINTGHKCAFQWLGPRRIVKANSEFVYSVKPLHYGRIKKVHSARLKPYNYVYQDNVVPEDVLDLAEGLHPAMK